MKFHNLPFVTLADDGLHVLPKGTPLAQLIPFRRDELEADVRAESPEAAADRERVHRSTTAGAGWYRKASRARRAGSSPRRRRSLLPSTTSWDR